MPIWYVIIIIKFSDTLLRWMCYSVNLQMIWYWNSHNKKSRKCVLARTICTILVLLFEYFKVFCTIGLQYRQYNLLMGYYIFG